MTPKIQAVGQFWHPLYVAGVGEKNDYIGVARGGPFGNCPVAKHLLSGDFLKWSILWHKYIL